MSSETQFIGMKAPATYQEWLICFDMMKDGSASDNAVFESAKKGSFAGTEITSATLRRQLVETVNAVLDKSAKRFIKDLNDSITFNDFLQTELLFHRLKKAIHSTLFFAELSFLPPEFRSELEQSVKKQMSAFWNDIVNFLQEQSREFSNSELEDVIFLVKRIKLF